MRFGFIRSAASPGRDRLLKLGRLTNWALNDLLSCLEVLAIGNWGLGVGIAMRLDTFLLLSLQKPGVAHVGVWCLPSLLMSRERLEIR